MSIVSLVIGKYKERKKRQQWNNNWRVKNKHTLLILRRWFFLRIIIFMM